MIIQLTPPSPHPTVLYPITFHDLPPTVTGSAAWTSQLNALIADSLECPASLHALDKAAFLPAVVREVAFTILPPPSRGEETVRVECKFIDGSVVSWTEGPLCAQLLHGVVTEVRRAGEEREREINEEEDVRRRFVEERERERASRLSLPNTPSSSSPPASIGRGHVRSSSLVGMAGGSRERQGKHRKQRSLFTSLVSFLLPSPPPTSHSPDGLISALSAAPSPSQAQYPRSLPPSPSTSLPPTRPPSPTPTQIAPRQSSHALRRLARASLVDITRRFVLASLPSRMTWGIGAPSHFPASSSCSSRSSMTAYSPTSTLHSTTSTNPAAPINRSYYLYIASSLHSRTSAQLASLVHEATGGKPTLVKQLEGEAGKREGRRSSSSGPRGRGERASEEREERDGWYRQRPEMVFDDTDLEVDESDGSSVRTPGSSAAGSYFPPNMCDGAGNGMDDPFASPTSSSPASPTPTSPIDSESSFPPSPKSPTSPTFDSPGPYPLSMHGHRHHRRTSRSSTLAAQLSPFLTPHPSPTTPNSRTLRTFPTNKSPSKPSPPTPTPFPPATLHAYTQLQTEVQRLAGLISSEHSRIAYVAAEVSHREQMVEVRSLRRAWLGRSLLREPASGRLSPLRLTIPPSGKGAKSKGNGNWGRLEGYDRPQRAYGIGYDGYGALGVPAARSPLGMAVFTAEDWERVRVRVRDVGRYGLSGNGGASGGGGVGGGNGIGVGGNGGRTRRMAVKVEKHLFPVVEECSVSLSSPSEEDEDDYSHHTHSTRSPSDSSYPRSPSHSRSPSDSSHPSRSPSDSESSHPRTPSYSSYCSTSSGGSSGYYEDSLLRDEELLMDLARMEDDAGLFDDDDEDEEERPAFGRPTRDSDDFPGNDFGPTNDFPGADFGPVHEEEGQEEPTIRLVPRRAGPHADLPLSPTSFIAEDELEELSPASSEGQTLGIDLDLEAGLPPVHIRFPSPSARKRTQSLANPISTPFKSNTNCEPKPVFIPAPRIAVPASPRSLPSTKSTEMAMEWGMTVMSAPVGTRPELRRSDNDPELVFDEEGDGDRLPSYEELVGGVSV